MAQASFSTGSRSHLLHAVVPEHSKDEHKGDGVNETVEVKNG